MRCDQCPVRPGLYCLGEHHKPVCRDVANGLPGRAAQLVDHAEGSTSEGKIRCGLLCPCLNMGGAEAQQLAIARFTDPDKVRWVGCAVTEGEQSVDPGMRAQTSRLMPVTVGPDAARRLAGRCDVIISWAVGSLAELVGPSPVKVVSVSHSTLDSPWGVAHNARASRVDRWVAVSELALAAIPKSARDEIPTSVIWNAVDTDRLVVTRSREAMHARWGVPPGSKLAGYLGRLSAEKDPHAMRRMVEFLPPDWHAVLVGSGAERLEAHGRLHLVGNDPAAGDSLNAFDVLVVPSHYESFCLTLAEGLWMGRPIASTRSGLAKMVPGLTTLIPIDADGPTMARAVLAAVDIVHTLTPEFRERLGPVRFGREWTDLIVSLAPPSRAELLSRVRECPSRGGVLPISMQPEGCQKCGEKSECRSGRGEIPGRVSLRECLECVSRV